MNNFPYIISFSGKKHAGKTALAKSLVPLGFKCVNFADGLKDLVCDSVGITREYLENNKDVILDTDFKIHSFGRGLIAFRTKIPEEIVHKELKFKVFKSYRESLQFIGTDIIRKYNQTFHINNLVSRVTLGDGPFAISDTRFIDELSTLQHLGASCFYIERAGNDSTDTHSSENELHTGLFKEKEIIYNNLDTEELFVETFHNVYLPRKF